MFGLTIISTNKEDYYRNTIGDYKFRCSELRKENNKLKTEIANLKLIQKGNNNDQSIPRPDILSERSKRLYAKRKQVCSPAGCDRVGKVCDSLTLCTQCDK